MMKSILKRCLAFATALCMLFVITPWMAHAENAGADVSTESETASPSTLADEDYPLAAGVNIMKKGAANQSFHIGEGQTLMISGQEQPETDPLVFENCTFYLSGGTVKISGNQEGISYNNGEVVTKLFISGNVQFENCTFVTQEDAKKTTNAGFDAAIYFFSGNIQLFDCTLSAEGYNGQFLGLYGREGAVTFSHSVISTVGNKNGWSYAMYGGSIMKLENGSTMSATGMSTDGSNINAFYSGDNKTGYDAIFVDDSTIDFSDNRAGGFAINNVNIHVNRSTIRVNDNLGNACNSGYWVVKDSTIEMNGNRGGHALSCIGFAMENSTLEVLHNGYAGVYVQSKDSSLSDCVVDIRCNGERLLSYTAGDLWLNGHSLEVSNCTSAAAPGAAWLGGVGRKGKVTTPSGSIVAYDLNSNAADNLKSNTEPVLSDAAILPTESHTLFLNPFMESAYARGNAENSSSDNDADLFADDRAESRNDIIGAENAKIGTLSEAQLSHHIYDWDHGVVSEDATEQAYGVVRYECTSCAQYVNHTQTHANSFDCEGTYVYAPLVGVHFEANTEDTSVFGMPQDQTQIEYQNTAQEVSAPQRPGYTFTGWYLDEACTQAYDFQTPLSENWTVLYAGWQQNTYTVTVSYYDIDTGESIHTSEIISDYVWGDAYDASAYDRIAISGYDYVETRGDALQGVIDADKTIQVYYRKTAEAPGTAMQDPTVLWGVLITASAALIAALGIRRRMQR